MAIAITSSVFAQTSNKGILTGITPSGTIVAKEYFVQSDDKAANLYIREIGNGKPVIVLHGGFGNDHKYVLDIANGLEDNVRFIFYDQRGSTLSFCEKKNISVANHVKDLETIRRKLNIDSFTLVSHSAGTVLAYLYLQEFPDKVENLVLLGAIEPKNGNLDFFTQEEQNTWEITKIEKEKFNSRPEVEMLIDSLGLNKKDRTQNEYHLYRHIKYYAAQNIYDIKKWAKLTIPHWNVIAAQAASESFNWEYNFVTLLDSANIPITIINGQYDFVVGGKGSPIWKGVVDKTAPQLNLHIIENAGHLSWIDKPEEFYRLFVKALTKKSG